MGKHKEIVSLTGVRGMAAFIVMIHHYIASIDSNFKKSSAYWDHGYLMVELFFVLSGFVMALSYNSKFSDSIGNKDYVIFMSKRFNRVYPLYFFSILYYYIIFHENPLWHLPLNFTFLQVFLPTRFMVNNVSWSLGAEWFIYLIFPYLLFKAYSKNIYFLMVFALLSFFIAPIVDVLGKNNNLEDTLFTLRQFSGPSIMFRCLGSYLLGIAAYKIYAKRQHSLFKILQNRIFISFFLIILVIVYGIERTDIVISFLFVILILILTSDNYLSDFFSSNIMYRLGLISYSIYINHMIFVKISGQIYVKYSLSSTNVNFMLFLVFTVLGTVLFSILTYTYLEKYLNKFLNNRLSLILSISSVSKFIK